MDAALARVGLNLGCALVAGALIGAERSYNGRAAGFRTNILVALAAAGAVTMAMQPQFAGVSRALGFAYADPIPQIAQGVMTGVGFLGGGVIFKEGVSVQGLTTAACIWAVAAVGLLFGVSMYGAGALLTLMILVTLIGLRVVESSLPRKVYALATFVFERDSAPDETALEMILGPHKVKLYDVSYATRDHGKLFELSANLVTTDESSLRRLAERLKETGGLVEFSLAKLSR
ncbi:MAG TPA: MgtC/SapB family protein [Caulobacteraceae bacterium]|nr:MgtC/SapB family protein [Caulobacteraceae bacterium]